MFRSLFSSITNAFAWNLSGRDHKTFLTTLLWDCLTKIETGVDNVTHLYIEFIKCFRFLHSFSFKSSGKILEFRLLDSVCALMNGLENVPIILSLDVGRDSTELCAMTPLKLSLVAICCSLRPVFPPLSIELSIWEPFLHLQQSLVWYSQLQFYSKLYH